MAKKIKSQSAATTAKQSATAPRRISFPKYGPCEAREQLDDLVRRMQPTLFDSEYIDARSAARLVAAGLRTYRAVRSDSRWTTDPIFSRLTAPRMRLNLVCAALFDLVCNVEYIHGRLTNDNWIYCNRNRGPEQPPPFAYYSFLKQCPQCCQDRGLEKRLAGAQHKPSSHHIGEITTTTTAFFLTLLGQASPRPLDVGVISKQSHDVDAFAWRDDLLVLFEIKASPLVTYPIRTQLASRYSKTGPDGPQEAEQHRLIDVEFAAHNLSLYLANTQVDVPLGRPDSASWPYPQLTNYITTHEGFFNYMRAWLEIFLGYSIPKTHRRGRDIVLGYLANGWGDEIDSNKTKAGLGRTDDIKKGTYQLLKFGAYYRAGCPSLEIRGILATNLDPIFLYIDYIQKLIDARWAPTGKFSPLDGNPHELKIREKDLYFLYDCILAFNQPVVNDPMLIDCFDFGRMEEALVNGGLDPWLNEWSNARCL